MDARPGLRVCLALALSLVVAPSALAADPNFTIEPFPPTAGDPTRFTAELDPGLEASWDFDEDDDFEVPNDTVVEHVFGSAAPAQVRMQASDGTVVTKDFTVNGPPVAAFQFSPPSSTTGQAVVFTSESTDPEGDTLEYRWDFGDGTFATGSIVEHAFTTPGAKPVQLTVTDVKRATRSVTRHVDVSVPVALLISEPPPAEAAQPSFMSPFPVVRLSGQVLPRATLVRLLTVQGPRGSLVRVRCVGRDCPADSARRRVKRAGVVRFRRFERSLRPGTRLAIFVLRGTEIGKYTRFAIRAGKRPLRTDRCLLPGQRKPVRCPA
jgi:PKD repeat protein